MLITWSEKDVKDSFPKSKLPFLPLKKKTKDNRYGQRQLSAIMTNITLIKKNCKLLPNISRERFNQKLHKCTTNSEKTL